MNKNTNFFSLRKTGWSMLFVGIAGLFLSLFALNGCDVTADEKDRAAQEQMLEQGQASVGMPAITNWSEKKNLKRILELRDQAGLQTYTYITDFNGGLHPLGKWGGRSIGFGISGATQYTNPMKHAYEGGALPQADPNGLFSPAADEGTWVILLDGDGNQQVVRAEPRTIVSTVPLI